MLNKMNSVTSIQHQNPRLAPNGPHIGGPVTRFPKAVPGNPGHMCKVPPQRQPQPGDVYIGGPGPKDQKQYAAKDLEKFGAKLEDIRPIGPFKLPDGAAIVKKLLGK